ncbi:hypothetical protein KR222_001940 [Zaprionus bogoriensis]|nr:hypothetical protein KR222_001940 [Zaprionus bogoriensis]
MPEQTIQEFHAAPAWLTREYVEQKLREYLKDEKLQLEQLHIKPATANGENYASVMTRINLEYKDRKLVHQRATFLVKTTFADKDPAAYILEPYGIYVREMNMYENVLPKLAKILRDELGDSRKYFAATMNVDRERDSIIFEDMSLEKYFVADRIQQLDLEHTQLVLEKLAAFHAASAVLSEREPGIFAEKYDRCFFNRHTRGYTPIMQNMLKALIQSLEDEPELYRKYGEKLKGVVENIMEYGERALEYKKGDFVTLCHGDIWTTNIMFHNNQDGKPDNVIFIDFQFSVFNSPAVDLQYFFSTSLQDDICQIEMVQFYHQKLVEALKKLKFKGRIPSLFDFQLQFQARSFYAVFSTFAFLPAMLKTGSEEFSIERAASFADSDAAVRVSLFKSEQMRKKTRKVLPIFDRKGLFDEM